MLETNPWRGQTQIEREVLPVVRVNGHHVVPVLQIDQTVKIFRPSQIAKYLELVPAPLIHHELEVVEMAKIDVNSVVVLTQFRNQMAAADPVMIGRWLPAAGLKTTLPFAVN